MRYDVIPERYNLGLPMVKRHDAGYVDLVWDAAARVWCKPAPIAEAIPENPVPDPAPRPRVLGHKRWNVFAGKVRLYILSASCREVAEAEAERLAGPGLRVEPEPVLVDRPVAGRGLSAAEVRFRLGMAK